ncbi:MAG: KH domain-containing protein [Candidatus Melainabacteria bacterium]|jgi:predicted RNA-binding protein YlqC (UPF0109 family)|nr:KH domain-containing protein [Candidatus Melainabacteria bacterium]MBX9671998.1 KH domain-containing protein [Candidatus Obscuribacterales bacterium]
MDEKRRSTKRYGGKPFKKGTGRRPGVGGSRNRILADSTAPEDLAEYILKVLAKDPDALQFERQSVNPGRSRVAVTCDPLVTGRLIGKDGRTITALRSLVRAAASRYGKRVDIEVS